MILREIDRESRSVTSHLHSLLVVSCLLTANHVKEPDQITNHSVRVADHQPIRAEMTAALESR